jgi:6-phosphogluconolactonase
MCGRIGMSEHPEGHRLTPIEVHPDAAAAARRGAEVIAAHARAAIGARGAFSLAVSGGRTPWLMFAELASADFPWAQTVVYQVDERIAPAGDATRNLTRLRECLDDIAFIQPMPVEAEDLQLAAQSYAESLPERFDLIHLGLGPDGHTASLVPGDRALDMLDCDVTLSGPYQGTRRMTLTYPVLDRARARLWVVTGEDKVAALRRLRERDHAIPAGRVKAEDSLILADVAAADA